MVRAHDALLNEHSDGDVQWEKMPMPVGSWNSKLPHMQERRVSMEMT